MPAASSFRTPVRGELVEVIGSRSRSELNGSVAEVVAAATDSEGRITVRLKSGTSAGGGAGQEVVKKVHMHRLRPAASSASPPGLGRCCTSPTALPVPPGSPLIRQCRTPTTGGSEVASRAMTSTAALRTPTTPQRWSCAESEANERSAATSRVAPLSEASLSMTRSPSQPAARGVDELQGEYRARRAAWKQGYLSALTPECGDRIHNAILCTDATDFSKYFIKSTGGIPMHKAFPKQKVKLTNPRTGATVPAWAP